MNGYKTVQLSAYDIAMAVIHISEEEAARDFISVMDRVRAGDEVRIDGGSRSYSVVPAPVVYTQPRLLSEILADLERRGSTATLPPGFAEDVEAAIRAHEHETLIDPWV